jgi:hypothetical protein
VARDSAHCEDLGWDLGNFPDASECVGTQLHSFCSALLNRSIETVEIFGPNQRKASWQTLRGQITQINELTTTNVLYVESFSERRSQAWDGAYEGVGTAQQAYREGDYVQGTFNTAIAAEGWYAGLRTAPRIRFREPPAAPPTVTMAADGSLVVAPPAPIAIPVIDVTWAASVGSRYHLYVRATEGRGAL